MESITIRIDKNMSKRMQASLKQGYGTKTEFIREAIRDKLKAEEERAIQQFLKLRGTAPKKTTYEENRKTREEVGKEIAKRFGIDI